MNQEKNQVWQIISFYITLFFLLALPACQKEVKQDFFNTYIQSDPGKLDPFYSTDVISGRVLTKICNGLFKINNEGELKRDIVDKFTFDGIILKAKLNENILFHQGSLLTSEDVIFSFKRIWMSANPTSPRKWVFKNIGKILKKGKHEIQIELKKPSATFLYLLSMPNCFIISKDSFIKEGKIIGTGPFILSEWKHDEKIVLIRNPEYFDKKPGIKGIIYSIISEDLTARFEFLNGTLDYFELPYLSKINLKLAGIKVIEIPELSVHYIALNNRKFPFNKRLFRTALNMAIDKKKIMKTILTGFKEASGPIPPVVGCYRSSTVPVQYNPKRAKEIIDNFCLNDKEIKIFIKSDHQVSLVAQMIQYYLRKTGLNINIREMEWAALKAATMKGAYDMAYFTWYADYPEVENFLFPLFYSKNIGAGGNRSFFANSEVDQLLHLAQRTIDEEKRFDIYHKIDRLLIKESPWIFLWYGDKTIALSKRIKRFVPNPIYCGMKGNEIFINNLSR